MAIPKTSKNEITSWKLQCYLQTRGAIRECSSYKRCVNAVRRCGTQCDSPLQGQLSPCATLGSDFSFQLGSPKHASLIRICSLHSWKQWTDEVQPLKELSLSLHGGPHLEAECKKSSFREGNQKNNLPRNIQTLTLFIRCILPSHVLHKEFSIKSTPIPRLYDCFATFLGGSTCRLGGSGRWLLHIEIHFLGS